MQVIDPGPIPSMPQRPPRHDDEILGMSFFRTMLAESRIEHMTLPRVFFCRSEIRATSFQGSDLSESTANWNDFVDIDFSEADISRSDFRGCNFERVRFNGAKLVGVDFRHCRFAKCDFNGADVSAAKFTRNTGLSLRLSSEQMQVVDWQTNDGEVPDGG